MMIKEIRNIYKKETNKEIFESVIFVKDKPQEAVTFSNEYVKWLEERLADFLTN